MAGLLNGKQLMDKTVSARKLAETYLPVEGGTITGDLTVTGNTTLSDKAMYKGSEIANRDDLYDDTGVKELIKELEQKKQDRLTAGDHITLSDSDVIGVDYDGLQDQLLQDQFIKTDSLSDYYTKPQVDDIIDNLDVDHAITADKLANPRNI